MVFSLWYGLGWDHVSNSTVFCSRMNSSVPSTTVARRNFGRVPDLHFQTVETWRAHFLPFSDGLWCVFALRLPRLVILRGADIPHVRRSLGSRHRSCFCILNYFNHSPKTKDAQVSRNTEHLGYRSARRDEIFHAHIFSPYLVCGICVCRLGTWYILRWGRICHIVLISCVYRKRFSSFLQCKFPFSLMLRWPPSN